MFGCELKEDIKGFPTVENGENKGLKDICPVFYYESEVKHDVWGNVLEALVGYASDKNIRFKAASGGALTELCTYLLDNGLVDGIIHTAFDPVDQTKTVSCVSYTSEDVRKRCGSRYSISVPLYNLKELMKDGETYAFVGKPCDVMALRRGIVIDPSIGKRIPYLLSFFCAGEPSVNAQNNLLQAIGTTREVFSSITYRGNGWPGYTTVTEKNGRVLIRIPSEWEGRLSFPRNIAAMLIAYMIVLSGVMQNQEFQLFSLVIMLLIAYVKRNGFARKKIK